MRLIELIHGRRTVKYAVLDEMETTAGGGLQRILRVSHAADSFEADNLNEFGEDDLVPGYGFIASGQRTTHAIEGTPELVERFWL